jgi:hypothetical protein
LAKERKRKYAIVINMNAKRLGGSVPIGAPKNDAPSITPIDVRSTWAVSNDLVIAARVRGVAMTVATGAI